MQMGVHAAKMIKQDLLQRPRTQFRYFDKGDMATIGRLAAVADVKWPFKAHWGGFPAWATWLVVHLWFLVSFRNRMRVMATWGWTYFFLTSGARLITGSQNLPGWGEHAGARPQFAGPRLDYASPVVGELPQQSGPPRHGESSDQGKQPGLTEPVQT
jgi:NADH dehydrogenase